MAPDNDNNPPPASGTARCPNCGRETRAKFRPFCSGRCKDLDLSRWLRGTYAIPGGNADEDEDGDDAALEQQSSRQAETDPD